MNSAYVVQDLSSFFHEELAIRKKYHWLYPLDTNFSSNCKSKFSL